MADDSSIEFILRQAQMITAALPNDVVFDHLQRNNNFIQTHYHDNSLQSWQAYVLAGHRRARNLQFRER